MKKYITSFLMIATLAVMIPFFANETNAQTRCYTNSRGRTVCREVDRGNFYNRHRNLINVGIGTAAGALIGGLIGGKKGALIGTAVGAGGSALYTYKLNPKSRRYERVYNRNYNRNYYGNYRRY
jgi:outer membrane lipoprotein SlyB